MRKQPRPTARPAAPDWSPAQLTPVYQLLVLALLGFLAWNVWGIRKSMPTAALATRTDEPPQIVEVTAADRPSREIAARIAVELFIRRNGCYTPRSEAVDGILSSAEQRAIRTCTAIQTARLMNGEQPNEERAIAWLQRTAGERVGGK